MKEAMIVASKSILLNVVIVISGFWILGLCIAHFFLPNQSNYLNFDILFLTICTYGLFKKELSLAKFGFFWFTIANLLSILAINATYISIRFLMIVSYLGVHTIFLWLGVFALSRVKNKSVLFDIDIFKPFRVLSSNSKKVIGLITAFFAILNFVPNNLHIAIVWLLIYIISIIKDYKEASKIMLALWALPYVVSIGEIFFTNYTFSSTSMIFLIGNALLLYIGTQGLESSGAENRLVTIDS